MIFKKNVIAVCDAYNTGQFIAPMFFAHGLDAIHIRTSDSMYHYGNSYRKHDFFSDMRIDQLDSQLDDLRRFTVLLALPGTETGVEIAEEVGERLQVVHRNPSGTGRRCRDKLAMQEALAAAGLAHGRQKSCRSLDEALAWARAHDDYPLVLKPLDGSTSDHVYLCRDEEAVKGAFARILGAQSLLERPNERVLIQGYLGQVPGADGETTIAYNVNSASFAGQHLTTEIMTVHKRCVGGAFIHDYMELLCPVGEADLFRQLEAYAHQVLDAVGLRVGLSHCEIIVHKGVPTLVEVAARAPGGSDPSFYARCVGQTQLSVLAGALFDPEAFHRRAAAPRQPLAQRGACVFLISEAESPIGTDHQLDFWLSRLPGLHSITIKDRPAVVVTRNLKDSPGHLYLAAANQEELAAQRRLIRQLESRYLASLAPGACSS